MDFIKKYNLEGINIELFNNALSHSSYTNVQGGTNYERLEFLGDAVLQLVISDYFYNNTDYSEGEMSKKRASYVCEAALYEYSKEIGIIEHIKTSDGQEKNATIVADVFEAIVGVIYLSLGIKVASKFVRSIIVPHIKSNHHFFDDYKTVLQEMTQTTKDSLEYVLIDESGPAHNKTFKVEVRIDGIVFGQGTGKSKKEAEQQAAYSAYQKRAKN